MPRNYVFGMNYLELKHTQALFLGVFYIFSSVAWIWAAWLPSASKPSHATPSVAPSWDSFLHGWGVQNGWWEVFQSTSCSGLEGRKYPSSFMSWFVNGCPDSGGGDLSRSNILRCWSVAKSCNAKGWWWCFWERMGQSSHSLCPSWIVCLATAE